MAKFFSDREIRAVAVFLPLAGLLIGGIVLLRPKADPQAAFVAGMEMEGRADSERNQNQEKQSTNEKPTQE